MNAEEKLNSKIDDKLRLKLLELIFLGQHIAHLFWETSSWKQPIRVSRYLWQTQNICWDDTQFKVKLTPEIAKTGYN